LTNMSNNIDDSYWEMLSSTPAWKAWAGYAFEAICFKHIHQIMKALHIPSGSEVYSWRHLADKGSEDFGGQIDLIFDRPDGVINLCEIKHSTGAFLIDKRYASHMQKRESLYRKVTKTNKQIFHSMIVSSGLKDSVYSQELIASTATLSDLLSTE
jgi:hypothetical protein